MLSRVVVNEVFAVDSGRHRPVVDVDFGGYHQREQEVNDRANYHHDYRGDQTPDTLLFLGDAVAEPKDIRRVSSWFDWDLVPSIALKVVQFQSCLLGNSFLEGAEVVVWYN